MVAKDDRNDGTKQLHIGPKMHEAWTFVQANPGTFESTIRLQFGRRVADRMIEAGMVEAINHEYGQKLYVKHEWYQDINIRPYGAAGLPSIFQRAKISVGESAAIRSVHCPRCKSDPFWRCTSKYNTNEEQEIGPHYERLIIWASRVLGKFNHSDLEFDDDFYKPAAQRTSKDQ